MTTPPYVLREQRGTFFAFAAADARIPPGQIVRLSTPAGAKLKGRIFYLVPIRTVTTLPLNSMTLVAVRVEDFGPRCTVGELPLPRDPLRAKQVIWTYAGARIRCGFWRGGHLLSDWLGHHIPHLSLFRIGTYSQLAS